MFSSFFSRQVLFSGFICATLFVVGCTQVIVSQETAVNSGETTPAAVSSAPAENVGNVTDTTPSAVPSNTPSPQPSIEPSAVSQTSVSADVEAFLTRFNNEGKTPEGAIKMLLLALLEIENNPESAKVILSGIYNGKSLSASSGSPTGFVLGNSELFIVDQMRKRPEIVRSYLGGTPEQNYENFDASGNTIDFPPDDTVVNGIRIDNSIRGNTEGRIYIKSGGKDLPTGIRLEQNSQGLFKISPSSVSSIATGVKQAEPTNF